MRTAKYIAYTNQGDTMTANTNNAIHYEIEEYANPAGVSVYTINAVDDYGERFDLNAGGEPCMSVDALWDFLSEMSDMCPDWFTTAQIAELADTINSLTEGA